MNATSAAASTSTSDAVERERLVDGLLFVVVVAYGLEHVTHELADASRQDLATLLLIAAASAAAAVALAVDSYAVAAHAAHVQLLALEVSQHVHVHLPVVFAAVRMLIGLLMLLNLIVAVVKRKRFVIRVLLSLLLNLLLLL